MWPFKKQKDVIDFTKKESYIPKKTTATSTVGYDDLTKANNYPSVQPNNQAESSFDFLGGMASVGNENSGINNAADDLSLKHLQVKMEDMEYKIDSIRSQINKIFDRLDLAEKKIDRGNRRGEF